MAFSIYPDRLDVVFNISGGETSVCYDILAICGFIGDKSREVIVDGNECVERAGMACMRDRVRDDPHRYRHYGRNRLWESTGWSQRT